MNNNNNNINNENQTNKENKRSGENFSFNFGCDDINGGFQQIYPEVFVVVTEILADAIAGKLPFNVQNAVGNWFELVGQIIITYNAQQQYFQGGPGRYFNPMYYNVSNPFCDSGATTEGNSSSGKYSENGPYSSAVENTEGNKTKKYNRNNNDSQIDELKKEIESLKKELKNIKDSMGI